MEAVCYETYALTSPHGYGRKRHACALRKLHVVKNGSLPGKWHTNLIRVLNFCRLIYQLLGNKMTKCTGRCVLILLVTYFSAPRAPGKGRPRLCLLGRKQGGGKQELCLEEGI